MKRGARGVLLAVAAGLLLSGCVAYVSEPTPGAGVAVGPAPAAGAWKPVNLRATGFGAPPQGMPEAQGRLMCQRAAEIDAKRNLLEEVQGVTIRSNTTVRDFVVKDDTIRANVEAFIRGAQVANKRNMSDGTCEVDVEITLGNDFYVLFVR